MPEDKMPEKHRGKSAKEIFKERSREAIDYIEETDEEVVDE